MDRVSEFRARTASDAVWSAYEQRAVPAGIRAPSGVSRRRIRCRTCSRRYRLGAGSPGDTVLRGVRVISGVLQGATLEAILRLGVE